ncbi:CD9 antigen [Nymphon striatum]|nr:CD9 antigen [Nymphon striatum]
MEINIEALDISFLMRASKMSQICQNDSASIQCRPMNRPIYGCLLPEVVVVVVVGILATESNSCFTLSQIDFLAGLTCVGVGAWLVRDSDFADIAGNIKDGDIFTGAYVLIGVGGTVFIVAMIGCCGAFIESKCMILTYFVFVVIVIIAELSTVCYIWSQYPEPYVFLENILSQEVLDYRTNEDSRTFLDTIQEKMRCCGVNSYSDYLNANTTEPRSCSDVDTHATYKTGCAAKIWPFISQLFVILGGIASGVGIFQVSH